MEKKWFVALLMVVVMMCACWTGAVAEDERDYQYALLMMEQWRLQGTMEKQKSSPFPICSMEKRLLPLITERFICVIL